jgi:hypothetical protein
VRGIVADEPGLYFVGLAFLTPCRQDFFPASAEMPNTSSNTSTRESNQPPTPRGKLPRPRSRHGTEGREHSVAGAPLFRSDQVEPASSR